MNADRYIRENSNYNQWAIHFKNRSQISEEDVKKICSEFATVKKVSQTGTATGLCFINFPNIEDARRCVEGLNGHPDIQLRENKIKVNTVTDSNKNFTEKLNSKTNHFSDNNNNFNTNGNLIYPKNPIEDAFFKDFISNPKSPNDDVDFNEDKIPNNDHDFGNEESIKEKNCFLRNTNDRVVISNKNIEDDDKFKKLLGLKNHNVINTSTFNILAEEREKELRNDTVLPEMPVLIPSRKIISQSNGVVETKLMPVIEAEEVIFADIPNDFSENYILHLVKKYEPLCASFVKVLEPHSLRYCYVYFPSPQLAEEVETKFDQFNLDDNKLIVLRTYPLKI